MKIHVLVNRSQQRRDSSAVLEHCSEVNVLPGDEVTNEGADGSPCTSEELDSSTSTTSNQLSTDDQSSSSRLPTCWTTEQWQKFKFDNDWLFLHDSHLGCLVCKSVSCLGPNRQLPGMKTKLSHEWVNGCVGPNGQGKHARQRSLRKKIFEHNKSAGHQEAQKAATEKRSENLKAAVLHQQTEQYESTCNVFRTAYYLAQRDRSYTDHSQLVRVVRAMLGCNRSHPVVKFRRPLHCVTALHDLRRPAVWSNIQGSMYYVTYQHYLRLCSSVKSACVLIIFVYLDAVIFKEA